MIAGDTYQRNFTLPVPVPPKSEWTASDKTQLALGQKAIGFNCLNYDSPPEPTLLRHAFPDRIQIDTQCKHGLRLELLFPSCWNGKDLDSADHRSHVAYPDLVDGGVCPEGFEHRFVTLLFETIWDTYEFRGKPGEFVIANGDPTGFGYHGDFIEAWEDGVLEQAIKQCTNLSGRVQDCPVFNLQSEADQRQCQFVQPEALGGEQYELNPDGLPGKVPVMRGPGYAILPAGYADPPTTSTSLTETSSLAPVDTPKLKIPQPDPVSFEVPKLTTSPQVSMTPPPSPPADKITSESAKETERILSTSYSTSGATVYEIVIVQKTVTRTVDRAIPTLPSRLRHRHARRHF